MMSPAMIRLARKFEQEEDEMVEEEEEEEKEMMPPHEYVTKKLTLSLMLSCLVLEGVGRTLNGRDWRQVRNAVLHQTGELLLLLSTPREYANDDVNDPTSVMVSVLKEVNTEDSVD